MTSNIETLHHLREALVLVAEHLAGGHPDRVEEERAAPDDPAADVVEAPAAIVIGSKLAPIPEES